MKRIAAVILLLFCFGCNSGIHYPEGGYDYPESIKADDTNFYYLPVRDSFSRRDSFFTIWYVKHFYLFFDEPNLSREYKGEDIFRLSHEYALGGSTIITLKRDSIIVKERVSDFNYIIDTNKLDKIEKVHYNLLQRRFSLYSVEYSFFQKRRIDSLLKLYPQLLDTKYYYSLFKKAEGRIDTIKMKYSVKRIAISHAQYSVLVNAINNSGYWKLPAQVECEAPPNDGGGYILEATTKKKYNYVGVTSCPGVSNIPLDKACQLLIDKAGLGDKLRVYWDGHIDSTDTSPIIVQDVNLENTFRKPKHKKKKRNH